MRKEIKIFFTALMFYTRFPVPKSTGYSSENLNRATKYFPLVGVIIGGLGALVFIGANYFLPVNVSVLFSLSIMILATGAFHEDALADFCDGFGGGYGKEQILKIMKDSFIGSYGTVGLIILLLSKFVLLIEFDASIIPFVLIVAHAASRVNPVIFIFSAKYVRDDFGSKSKPVGEKHKTLDLFIALLFGLSPLLLLPLFYIPAILAVLAFIVVYFRYYLKKKIGGYTGDVLGALQQFSELGVYISILLTQGIHAYLLA
ncbi:MAG: adenosylcobinamide-GDP ribazoletransferase [Salinivirgaceae bacterium]|jgi:adenosylcobinamide-GDP ribazoletransferase|nr:adenosylcobinamide-GDP ribazoletransferase [Salinivirgaceae bacterium]